jgi:CheY-like chemotaxis protein
MTADKSSVTPRKKILVVDDEEIIRDLIPRVLVRAGYDVETATSGVDALEVLARMPTRPDLLMVDLSMPKMNGRELVRNIRADAAYASIPVVFLSGMITEEVEAGFPTLQKPAEVAEIVATVRQLIGP